MSRTTTACEVCGRVDYPHFHSEVAQTLWNVTVAINLNYENAQSEGREDER